ncbi:MAG: hypothetical protein LBV58_03995 [Acholeplasmatales bacterium]|jgi:hypothetical protein|nr:hypothetical protein [Acholeplasmatales bacterium]
MLKVFLIVLYGFFGILVGYFLYTGSYVTRAQKLLEDTNAIEAYQEDPDKFLSIQLALSSMYIDSHLYFSNDPIFSYNLDDTTDTFTLEVYSAGLLRSVPDEKGKVRIDSLFFYFRNLESKDGSRPIYKIIISVSDPTFLINDQYLDQTTVILKPFDDEGASPLFSIANAKNELLIPDTTNYSTITGITIYKGTQGDVDDSKEQIYGSIPLISLQNNLNPGSIPSGIHNDIFSYQHSDYEFKDVLKDNVPTPEEAIQYDLNIIKVGNLKDYNHIIVLTMSIFVIIYVGLAYLLFINKLVLARLKKRKLNNVEVVTPRKEESIFVDVEETDSKLK